MTEQETIPITMKYPHWQREFEAALVDGDPHTLRQRVDAAEAALFLRSQALAGSAPNSPVQKAFADALRTLRGFQR